MTMSQQPILLTITYLANAVVCNSSDKNNTHTLGSLHIFLESNYKEVGLKSPAEYRIQHLLLRHQEFQ